MKSKHQNILIVFLIVCTLVTIVLGKTKWEADQKKYAESFAVYEAQENKRQAKIAKIEQSIYADIPGIVAWGDSLTAGGYPRVLQNLINRNIYDIPVVNMGVGGENTNTIIGRAGSVPYIVDAFKMPEDTSKVEIHFKSANGNSVAPLRQGDRGLNPIVIDGVEGIISIDQESVTSEDYTYYFQRSENGDAVNIKDGTIIETASFKEFNNYVPIVFIGQNGGYQKNEDLITQINSILNMDKYNDKYLVIGLSSGTQEYRKDLETLMEDKFGDRYINLRELLSANGLKMAGIEPTKEDLKAMEVGSIPPSLLSDGVHYNNDGIAVVGQIVFERMQKLGYLDNARKLAEEINAL